MELNSAISAPLILFLGPFLPHKCTKGERKEIKIREGNINVFNWGVIQESDCRVRVELRKLSSKVTNVSERDSNW